MRVTGAVAALVLSTAVAGCGLVGPDDRTDERRDLASARALWVAQGIDDYDLTVERHCFCGFVDPVTLMVRDGVRTGLIVPDGYLGPPLPVTAFPHVDELFEIIADAIGRRAHRLRVVYHPTLGYPTEVVIDYRENVVDEEVTYRALLHLVDGSD